MSGWPTLAEILAGSDTGLEEFLRAVKLPASTLPSVPTTPGAVQLAAAIQVGAARIMPCWVVGDGTTTQFTVKHSLGAVPVDIRASTNASGIPASAIEIPWVALGSDPTNQAIVAFPIAPTSGTTYFLAVIA